MSARTSRTTANAKPRPKPKPGPKADAPIPMGPAELDEIHRKAIQSIDAAGKAMSVARANVEMANSREERQKAVAKAGVVVGPALLAPSRHVAKLLRGLGGALFAACKPVGSALAVLTKHEVNRHQKDVHVLIVHFDLARALVHIGSLNRKSRPAKSTADPLVKLLKDFKGVIQEFDQFSEGYYESVLKHLEYRKRNKDNLNSFAYRVAQFKRSLISVLSQQPVQHPGKHMDALTQIESRLVQNRAFYATNEEIAEVYICKQSKRAEVSVRPDGRRSKQSAGTVGRGATHGISSASAKKTTSSTVKQAQKQATKALPNAKPTRSGFGSKLLGKFGSSKQQKDSVDTKSGRPRPPERSHKQAPKTPHAPTRGQRTGQQQKRTSDARGKLQTSRVQGQQHVDTVNTAAMYDYSYSVEGEEGGAEQEDEYGDSEEGAGDSADPELGDEYGDSEEGAGDSEDPELEDEYGDSEEGAGDSEDPELEDEYGDSEEGAGDSEDPELDDEYGDSEEGAGDSEDPELDDEYGDSEEGAGDSEEGAGDSEDPEQEDEYGDGEEGPEDSEGPDDYSDGEE